MQTILIVDDHTTICSILSDYMTSGGFCPLVAHTGEEALELFAAQNPDLVLLDVMLPGMDGIQVLKELRKQSDVPVLMISAKTEEKDRIRGLDEGADDYIIKPFSPAEVLSRVRAALRRVKREKTERAPHIQGLTISLEEHTAFVHGKKLKLTRKELDLLWVLVTQPGRVFTRDNLLNLVWGYEHIGNDRAVDTHIKRLRSKMDEAGAAGFEIKTVWGVGYAFEVDEK